MPAQLSPAPKAISPAPSAPSAPSRSPRTLVACEARAQAIARPCTASICRMVLYGQQPPSVDGRLPSADHDPPSLYREGPLVDGHAAQCSTGGLCP